MDDRLTRGGPAAERPRSLASGISVSSDPRKPLVGSFAAFHQFGAGGSSSQYSLNMTLKPAPNWELSLRPSFARDILEAQYLQRVSDPSATATYGARYVFADLDQRTFVIETRLNYTFSPLLSLQMYAQPFIAAADFGSPKELAAPRTFEFRPYSGAVPDRDFNLRSLRGNAVLRWEWRPGSTMFLAWQQTREDFRPIGDFGLSRDLDALFTTPADNILLLKVTYWLNP